MIKKLQVKFICITMALVTVMLCVIFGLVFHFTRSSLEAESIQFMESVATRPFQLGRPGEPQEQVQLPYFVAQISIRGEIVATGGGYFDLSDSDYLLEVIRASLETGEESGLLEGYSLRFCRVSNLDEERLVFVDISSEEATLADLARNCGLIGLASLLAFLGISAGLSHWAVKPVDQAWKQQKQFVADASHELKTPLTVILTNAELLQSGDYNEESRAQFADSILVMARQMRTLVERLLELTRVDNGSANMVMAPTDLSGLISDGLLPFEPLFFERELELQAQIQPDIAVKGSSQHLGQVLDILLDNALKYSAPRGTVWVALRRQGGHAILTVANPGPAIEEADLENIFKRFYRVDKARSRDGSYGLGLSIARSIVTEHRGRIWAQSEDGINAFFVQLPIL